MVNGMLLGLTLKSVIVLSILEIGVCQLLENLDDLLCLFVFSFLLV